MLESLQIAPPDAILGLAEAFRKDTNPNKINLTVGVYKDADGKTPILKCVKAAERQLLDAETNKAYLGIDGLPEYGSPVRDLLFGEGHAINADQRGFTIQTPGGTGGLRVAADFLRTRLAAARIWVSTPTWANHGNVFRAAGLEVKQYAYIDAAGTGLDFDAMLADLQQVPHRDVVLLHACCHNPTGVDLSAEQWQQVTQVIQERELMPLVDFAYQGFGDGLDADASGLRTVVETVPEALVCSSFSKNFGLYAERIGALTVVASTPEAAQAALSHVKLCVRCNYSNPPKHGGAIVAQVLQDAALRAQWEGEVADMRNRINSMRQLFADTMQKHAPQYDSSFIVKQRGMFSYSGLTPIQVDELKNQHGVYIVRDGRINIAGMNPTNIEPLCQAIASVL